jgi:FkbM family methyltransferase
MKRSILRIKKLFKIPYNASDLDYSLIHILRKSSFLKEFDISKGILRVIYRNDQVLYARLHPNSDLLVLKQVLCNEEYLSLVEAIKLNNFEQKILRIIDAGANVGYASAYFRFHFPNANIACVEPDNGNIDLLRKNFNKEIDNGSVVVFANALSNKSGNNFVITHDFRDGKDWSKTVSLSETDSSLKSISIDGILKEMKWQEVDLLKIDIEGSERFLFQDSASANFLEKVRVIAIEIHDEFGVRDDVYQRLKEHDFFVFTSGETTIGVNKKHLCI